MFLFNIILLQSGFSVDGTFIYCKYDTFFTYSVNGTFIYCKYDLSTL